MKRESKDRMRQAVRQAYAGIAKRDAAGCCCDATPWCCEAPPASAEALAGRVGYSPDEIAAVPEGANMGLGCGNPQAIASLRSGEVVLDLGSGGGFDCFLAARQVGEGGRVIGVDMTPEMVAAAREKAHAGGYANVEFRLGEIEALPVADASVDVVMSNCVINLSPEKGRVLREAYRVLKPGGRLAVTDIVATAPMPDKMRNDLALLAACVAGAATVEEVTTMLRDAGFARVRVEPVEESREFIREWMPGLRLEEYIVSATIEGVKGMPE